MSQSSAMYHESGYGDTAGQVLTKAAKYVNKTTVTLDTKIPRSM